MAEGCKLFFRNRNCVRRKSVLLDPEDYECFKKKRIYEISKGVLGFYYRGKERRLHREILGLTDAWHVVKFNNCSSYDLRKENMTVHIVPEENRNKFAVQKPRTRDIKRARILQVTGSV